MNAPFVRRLNVPPARAWQSRAVDFARELLINQGADHMYLCAPTGTGKSRAVFEIIEALEVPGVHYLTVGMKPIVDQHRDALLSYGCRLVSATAGSDALVTPSGQQVIIETWQALAAMARRGANAKPAGFLIFDECHVGGSKAENVSFANVRAHLAPAKLLNVSATPQTAAEELLGEKAGCSFYYTMAEAYADGLLNPVDMVEVHAGTVGKIAKVEKAFGRDMEQLETLSAADLHHLAKRLKAKEVAITEASVSRIVDHRHDVMIDLYLQRHLGDQAIFYTPSIRAAEQAAERFNRKAGGQVRAEAIHSDLPEAAKRIGDFRAGRVGVMFAVGMLQEGFDMPSLRLAFDCRYCRKWTEDRIARLIQKIGRLIRREERKPRSLYYYARDITDFYRAGAVELPDVLDFSPFAVAAELEGDGDAAFVESAVTAVARVRAEIEGAGKNAIGGLTIQHGAVQTAQVGGGTAKLVAATLYALAEVSDAAVAKSISFAAMFGREADEKKAQLLELARGAPRPQPQTALARALARYTSPGASYDPAFAEAIRERHPDWYESSAQRKKAALLAMAPGVPRPRRRCDPLAEALASYTCKTQAYDAEFDAAIRRRQPQWFSNGPQPRRRKDALLALPQGAPRPKAELLTALQRYTSRSRSSYDAEFDAAIRERHPDWFGSSASRKKAVLLALPEGAPRPEGKLYGSLVSYTTKGDCYDAGFDAAIRERHPGWFRRAKRPGRNKEELFAMPEARLARGGAFEALQSYTVSGAPRAPTGSEPKR